MALSEVTMESENLLQDGESCGHQIGKILDTADEGHSRMISIKIKCDFVELSDPPKLPKIQASRSSCMGWEEVSPNYSYFDYASRKSRHSRVPHSRTPKKAISAGRTCNKGDIGTLDHTPETKFDADTKTRRVHIGKMNTGVNDHVKFPIEREGEMEESPRTMGRQGGELRGCAYEAPRPRRVSMHASVAKPL